MNISLNQIIYEIRELYRAVPKNTDSLTNRQIVDWVQNTRSLILKQRYSKPLSTPNDTVIQDLGSIQMEQVNSSSVSSIPTPFKMVRTEIDIPDTIDIKGTEYGMFTRVGPADRLDHTFNLVNYDRALHSGWGKFNQSTIYMFLLNKRLYAISRDYNFKSLEYINVRGVFQNPIEAAKITNSSYTYDDDYPINRSLIDDIKKMIIQNKFQLIFNPPMDKITDDEDDLAQESNKER